MKSSAAIALPSALDADLDELAGRRPTAAAALARAMHHTPAPPSRAEEQLVRAGLVDLARAELAAQAHDFDLHLEHGQEAIRSFAAALRLARRSA